MTRRRGTYDAMRPLPETTWLVVKDRYGTPISVTELPPHTDPRMVMIKAMAHSIGRGWEVEELPGTIPIYFARKGEDRREISIVRKQPEKR